MQELLMGIALGVATSVAVWGTYCFFAFLFGDD